jgi:hypothetical protein
MYNLTGQISVYNLLMNGGIYSQCYTSAVTTNNIRIYKGMLK